MAIEIIITIMILLNTSCIMIGMKYEQDFDIQEISFIMAFLNLIVLLLCLMVPFKGVHNVITATLIIFIWGGTLYLPNFVKCN